MQGRKPSRAEAAGHGGVDVVLPLHHRDGDGHGLPGAGDQQDAGRENSFQLADAQGCDVLHRGVYPLSAAPGLMKDRAPGQAGR